MLNIRKETEVAIHLLKYLSKTKNKTVSLKEVSEELGLSFLFLQKIARKLRVGGLIEADQGVNGGYRLKIPAANIALTQILKIMDDDCVLLGCMKDKKCPRYKKCSTRVALDKINEKVFKLFSGLKLKDL